MSHARRRFGGQQVLAGGLEEIHDRRILERGRVGEIHHHLRAGERLGQARTR